MIRKGSRDTYDALVLALRLKELLELLHLGLSLSLVGLRRGGAVVGLGGLRGLSGSSSALVVVVLLASRGRGRRRAAS